MIAVLQQKTFFVGYIAVVIIILFAVTFTVVLATGPEASSSDAPADVAEKCTLSRRARAALRVQVASA